MQNFTQKIEHSKKVIKDALAKYSKIGVACSFGKDSMTVVHLAREVDKNIPVFAVMTVFKPDETLNYLTEMDKKMNLNLTVYLVSDKPLPILEKAGIKTVLLSAKEFHDNWDASQKEEGKSLYEAKPDLCCKLLKVDPTKEAVKDLDAWVTGLRSTEGYTREDYKEVEEKGGLIKINPILDWTELDIWRYLAINQIPVNPLYAQGYRSLGCAPCSKIIGDDQLERAGRWQNTSKCGGECGIHTQPLK